MAKPGNDLLYAVKLHLATDCRCSGFDQCRIPSVVRGNGNNGQLRVTRTTLTNKLLTLAVVEVVIRENQIITAGR